MRTGKLFNTVAIRNFHSQRTNLSSRHIPHSPFHQRHFQQIIILFHVINLKLKFLKFIFSVSLLLSTCTIVMRMCASCSRLIGAAEIIFDDNDEQAYFSFLISSVVTTEEVCQICAYILANATPFSYFISFAAQHEYMKQLPSFHR